MHVEVLEDLEAGIRRRRREAAGTLTHPMFRPDREARRRSFIDRIRKGSHAAR